MPRPRSVSSDGPAARLKVAIVVSRYNASITGKLLEGALSAHPNPDQIEVIPAPGAFELPALALAAAKTGRFHGVVALGCLIKGETIHDRVIADAVAQGLVQATIATGIPITFGVLTVDTPKQAKARAGGSQGNKGADAMHALLETIAAMNALERRMNPSPARARTTKPDKAARPRSRR